MTTRSVWDDLTDQAKEAIREVDKQLAAAAALAVAAEIAENALEVLLDNTNVWDDLSIPLGTVTAARCELSSTLREYREVSK